MVVALGGGPTEAANEHDRVGSRVDRG